MVVLGCLSALRPKTGLSYLCASRVCKFVWRKWAGTPGLKVHGMMDIKAASTCPYADFVSSGNHGLPARPAREGRARMIGRNWRSLHGHSWIR